MATIIGSSGDNTLSGTLKSDTILGGAGDDYIDAGNGDDIVDGGDDDDILFGGNGQDTLFGGRGNDWISGGNGRDLVFGGSGNDTIGGDVASSSTSENGSETLYGDGYDSYDAYLAHGPLSTAPGNDTIYSGNGSDTIYGDNGNNRDGNAAGGNDVIRAGNGADTLWGEGGNDTLYGELGNDMLYGGWGDDTLFGGLGADTLTGGAGNDLFTFNVTMSWSDSNWLGMDTITDFTRGQDKLDLGPVLGTTDLNWGSTAPTAYGVWYQDQPDGTTLVYADIDGNAATAELVIKLNGLYDLSKSDFLGLVNAAPVITSNGSDATAAISMAENSAAVTTVTATDADAGTLLSYSIVGGADAALFTINATTGVLAFTTGPNREAPTDSDTNNVYEVTVRASDGALFDDQAISITITDIDEFDVSTPVDSDATSNAVDENAALGTTVGIMAFASDADATTNAITYSLTDDAAGRFAINSSTGEVNVAGAIDREGDGASLNITVRATSADGSTADETFSIAINDVDEFDVSTPVDNDGTSNAVDENAALGTTVGIMAFAADADATTNTVTYSLTDDAGGRFAINSSTGEVTVAGAIDREGDGASLNIEVTATSADGSTAAQTFAIAINDVDEFDVSTPVDSDGTSNAVDENAALGTTVGLMAFASDADATTNTVTYSLIDDAGGRFTINSSTGEVSVADGSLLNYEAATSHNITIQASSSDGSTSTQVFSIALTDVNEAPVITSNGGDTAAEVSMGENSTAVTTVTASDVDAGATQSYSIVGGADMALFTIDPTTGALAFAAAPNFEAPGDAGANNIYDVTVRVSDGALYDEQTLAITVTNVNEAPVNTIPGAQSTNEDTARNISGLSIADVDAGTGSVTVTLSVTHGKLTVSGGTASITGSGTAIVTLTGTVTAINSTLAAIVSYSSNANYNGNDTLTMVTNDNGNTGSGSALSDSDTVAITVLAINDAPLAATDLVYVSNGTTATISANALLGNDSDSDGLALTISSVSGATGGVSGLTLNANGTITFASSNASSGSFTYTVADGAGGTSTGTVNVTIVTTTGTINTIDLSATSYQASYIDGKNGNDPLTGSSAPDTFLGGAGDDTLIGGTGDDVLRGGGGNDTLNGNAGTDLLDLSDVGGGFTLTLGAGGSGTATVNGTDTYSNMEGIIGGSGNDILTGNASDNVLRGGAGNDTLNGGAGIDLLDLSDGTAAVSFTLTQSSSATTVNLSSIGLSTVTGDNYANMEGVIGTAFADTLTGSSGNDSLRGGGGNDILLGGSGDDLLSGGAGADTLTGGLGADTIKLFASDPGSVDTVTDFATGAGGDVLDCSDLLIGYTGVDLTSYIDTRESGSTTIVSVDRDGAATAYSFQDVVVLDGVLGQTALTLQASGNLHLV